MRILVLGTGQGGTSLLLEAVRGLGMVSFTNKVEDREFFNHEVLPQNYGTKLTTDCVAKITPLNFSFFLEDLKKSMNKYANLYIVFSLRHPIDVFMAQLVRGQRPSEGGDGNRKKNRVSDSGTIDGSLFAISHAHNVYKNILALFPKRIITVKLEDLVLMPEIEVERIAKFFGVKPTRQAYEFYKYNRNLYQKERYGNSLDKSVIGINKRWDTWHNGFFKNRESDINLATNCLSNIIQDLGYKLPRIKK
jgi:hypothetical protein